MNKIDPDSEEYRKLEIGLAFCYAPDIYPCMKCGNPVAKGYCCGHCGDSRPYEK